MTAAPPRDNHGTVSATDHSDATPPTGAQHSAELEVAVRLAREAGNLIRDALGRARNIDRKSPVNLVTEVDREAEKRIVGGLQSAFPSHRIVAEESAGDEPGGRPSSDGEPCWYVDPLDGTTNFVHGLPHCSVSIAMEQDSCLAAAVVHDPVRDETCAAVSGRGATLETAGSRRPLGVSDTAELDDSLMVTGFPYDRRDHIDFYMSYMAAFMARARDIRRFGSAALDLCYVAAGRFDGFWEWKLQPWDTAAGALIVTEAGGRVSDYEGKEYDPWGDRILATNGRIHAESVGVLAALPAAP